MSDRLVHRPTWTLAAASLQLVDGLLTATLVAPVAQTAAWAFLTWLSPRGFAPLLSLGLGVLVAGGLLQAALSMLALGAPVRFRRAVYVVGALQLVLTPFGKLHAPLVLLVPGLLAFLGRPRPALAADEAPLGLGDDELTRVAAA